MNPTMRRLMKNKAILILSIISLLLILPSPIWSQEDSTSSANIDSELIKENVKRRIQEVVKGEGSIQKEPVAITGKLLSVANSTLTIDGREGPQLASISAQTTFAKLPGSTPIEFEDISIDDYIVALGFVNGSDVLDTKRIITQKTIPQPSSNQTVFGKISSFDSSTDMFTITNLISNETNNFIIGEKSDINIQVDLDQSIPFDPRDDLPQNSYALVIFTPVENENQVIVDMLIKEFSNPTDNNLDDEVVDATSSSNQTPPELRQ